MRVTYSRELSVKEGLDRLSIENFLPMQYAIVGTGENRRRELVPAIHSLIFIHSTQPHITELKTTRREFLPLRYMMRQATSDTPRQMPPHTTCGMMSQPNECCALRMPSTSVPPKRLRPSTPRVRLMKIYSTPM